MQTEIGSIQAYYEVHGDGFPIVFLHGWGVDHRMMKGSAEPVFRQMNKAYKRIYVDLPGMGNTKVDDSITSTDDMRSFLIRFIDLLIPGENYAVVGKSYGGYLARGIARSHARRISGLFQVCPVAFYETQLLHAPKRVVLEREEGIRDVVPDREWEDFDLFHVIQTRNVWETYREYVLPGTKAANYDFLGNTLEKRKAFSEEIDTDGERYPFPAVFFCGRQDWCVGYSDLYTIFEHYDRASYIVVDKAGHNAEFEQPEVFSTHLLKWIDDVAEYEKSRTNSTST